MFVSLKAWTNVWLTTDHSTRKHYFCLFLGKYTLSRQLAEFPRLQWIDHVQMSRPAKFEGNILETGEDRAPLKIATNLLSFAWLHIFFLVLHECYVPEYRYWSWKILTQFWPQSDKTPVTVALFRASIVSFLTKHCLVPRLHYFATINPFWVTWSERNGQPRFQGHVSLKRTLGTRLRKSICPGYVTERSCDFMTNWTWGPDKKPYRNEARGNEDKEVFLRDTSSSFVFNIINE